MPSTRPSHLKRIPQGIVRKADVLLEALPYLQAFRGKTFVIKHGGSALLDPVKRRGILEDIIFLSVSGIRPVLVHGAGPEISKAMEKQGGKPRFVQGLRVTDAKTLQVVIKTLTEVNRRLVKELRLLGGRAQGVSGFEGGLLRAEKFSANGEDLGFVGKITSVNPGPIQRLLVMGIIPVVVPVGTGWDGQHYNVNADEAAAALAAGLKAEKFVLVTDVPGIIAYREKAIKKLLTSSTEESERESIRRKVIRRLLKENEEQLISTLTSEKAEKLIKKGIISGGMIPKTRACIHALQGGVKKTHMIDVQIPHGLLLEIFTDRGIGTEITHP